LTSDIFLYSEFRCLFRKREQGTRIFPCNPSSTERSIRQEKREDKLSKSQIPLDEVIRIKVNRRSPAFPSSVSLSLSSPDPLSVFENLEGAFFIFSFSFLDACQRDMVNASGRVYVLPKIGPIPLASIR